MTTQTTTKGKNMPNTYKTVEVAEAILASASRDTWRLADAVLADVPDQGHGGDRRSNGTRVPVDPMVALADVVTELEAAGVTTPNGDPYTAGSLYEMRRTAMAWPARQRHDEAAYRTHQEVQHKGDKGRVALTALCAVARGESVQCPEELDETAFVQAAGRVRSKLSARARRYPVAANDVRIALEHKPNIPTADRMPTTTIELLAVVSNMGENVRHFARIFGDSKPDLGENERRVLVANIESLIGTLNDLIAIVKGVSDADLDRLLIEGARDE